MSIHLYLLFIYIKYSSLLQFYQTVCVRMCLSNCVQLMYKVNKPHFVAFVYFVNCNITHLTRSDFSSLQLVVLLNVIQLLSCEDCFYCSSLISIFYM